MANFATHLNVSAFVSGILAATIGYAGYAPISNPKDSLIFFLAGIVGGVLPDIDHDKSTPIKILQFIFSNLFAFFITFKYIGKLPLLNVLAIWIGSFIIANFLFFIFKKFTTHRGIIHSIPAAFISLFLTTLISFYYFHFSIIKSYLLGFFVFIGFITHLVLDEIYSVDIMGNRLKKSFGSAFKFFSKDFKINLITYFILFVTFLALPDKEIFFKLILRNFNV